MKSLPAHTSSSTNGKQANTRRSVHENKTGGWVQLHQPDPGDPTGCRRHHRGVGSVRVVHRIGRDHREKTSVAAPNIGILQLLRHTLVSPCPPYVCIYVKTCYMYPQPTINDTLISIEKPSINHYQPPANHCSWLFTTSEPSINHKLTIQFTNQSSSPLTINQLTMNQETSNSFTFD